MKISVKFINFDKKDVIATSCAYARVYDGSLGTVKFLGTTDAGNYKFEHSESVVSVPDNTNYYWLYDTNGDCLNDWAENLSDLELEKGKKYHVVIDGPTWEFYLCGDDHELGVNPFIK